MKKYFLFNIAINIDNKWFLPFEQYELIGETVIPLVFHITRSGYMLEKEGSAQLHYIIKKDDQEHIIPSSAGVITDIVIPKEWVNRNRLWFEKTTDNIRDYIKAAAEYLNIEIRYRPETSAWYRESKGEKPKQIEKIGDNIPEEIKRDAP
jgi:hypothetical protein